MEEKKLTFFGGSFISFVPILVFVIVAVYIATTMTEITIQAMWVGILIGIIVTFFFAKDKHLYGDIKYTIYGQKIALTQSILYLANE